MKGDVMLEVKHLNESLNGLDGRSILDAIRNGSILNSGGLPVEDGRGELIGQIVEKLAHNFVEELVEQRSGQREDALGKIRTLGWIVNSSISEQVNEISRFRNSLDNQGIVIPSLKLEDGMGFFEFLVQEKIFTKPKLKESILKTIGLEVFNQYSGKKIPKQTESEFKTVYLLKAGSFDFRTSKNPHAAFDISLEYRLLRWGLSNLGLPSPRKLNEINNLYPYSEEFQDKYLGLVLAPCFAHHHDDDSEDPFFPLGMLGIIEQLSILLEDNELNCEQWNAVACVLFAIASIGGTELAVLPMMVNKPELISRLENPHNDRYPVEHLDNLMISETQLKPLLEVFLSISALGVESSNDKPSVEDLIVAFTNNTSYIGNIFSKVIANPEDVNDINGISFEKALKKYIDSLGCVLKTIEAHLDLISESKMDLLTSTVQNHSVISKGQWNIKASDYNQLFKDFEQVVSDHNKFTPQIFPSLLDELKTTSVSIKNCIDAGKIDDATKGISRISEIKALAEEKLEGHCQISSNVVKFLTGKMSEQNNSSNQDDLVISDKELQGLRDQILSQEQKIDSLCVEMAKKKSLISELNSEKRKIIESSNSIGFSKELECILFGRPREATCLDVLTVMKQRYPYVEFADNTLVSIKECQYSNAKKLFEVLNTLCSEYYDSIVNQGQPDSEAKKLLGRSYRQGESDTVMGNSKLRAYREFKYKGEIITVAKHITIGAKRNPSVTVQIHFDILGKKLLIARIGEHLPVLSTS